MASDRNAKNLRPHPTQVRSWSRCNTRPRVNLIRPARTSACSASPSATICRLRAAASHSRSTMRYDCTTVTTGAANDKAVVAEERPTSWSSGRASRTRVARTASGPPTSSEARQAASRPSVAAECRFGGQPAAGEIRPAGWLLPRPLVSLARGQSTASFRRWCSSCWSSTNMPLSICDARPHDWRRHPATGPGQGEPAY